jgi:hypothetical protein
MNTAPIEYPQRSRAAERITKMKNQLSGASIRPPKKAPGTKQAQKSQYPEAAEDTKKIDGCLYFGSIFIGAVCVGIVLAYMGYCFWIEFVRWIP